MARLVVVTGMIVLLVVAATPPVSGLPDPRQNDAGYGTDAPDDKRAALPLEQGTYHGNVTHLYDRFDQYRLDPPPRTVVRIQVQAEVLDQRPTPPIAAMARLESRIGEVHQAEGSYLGDGTWQWNITAGAGSRVNLTMLPGADQELTELIPYELTVIYDRYDHARLLDGGERNASAWRIRVPEGVPARFEGYGWGGGRVFRPDWDHHWSHTVLQPPGDCEAWTAYQSWPQWPVPGSADGRSGLDKDSVVWTHGLPRDVHAGSPVQVYDGVLPGTMIFPREVDRRDGNFTVRYGHGASRSLGPLGWVVWDGPVAPEIEPLYARARFATLEEFDDGGGQAIQVGPYVTAENLSLSWTVPDRGQHTVHLLIDGTTPKQYRVQTGLEEARMRVEKPDGTTFTLVDDWRVWATDGDAISPEAHGPIQAGPWEFTAEHVDGAEGDHLRAHVIEFGFDPGCPEDEETPGSAEATDGGGGGSSASDCGLLCGVAGAVEGVLGPVRALLG